MTTEQKRQAQDILATLISFDCQGIVCNQCPFFSRDIGACMVVIAQTKFDELNSEE